MQQALASARADMQREINLFEISSCGFCFKTDKKYCMLLKREQSTNLEALQLQRYRSQALAIAN